MAKKQRPQRLDYWHGGRNKPIRGLSYLHALLGSAPLTLTPFCPHSVTISARCVRMHSLAVSASLTYASSRCSGLPDRGSAVSRLHSLNWLTGIDRLGISGFTPELQPVISKTAAVRTSVDFNIPDHLVLNVAVDDPLLTLLC